MHNLISATIVAISTVGIAAPALAASHMGAQAAPHMVVHQAPHLGVHRVSTPTHIDGFHHDRDDGHRHRGGHRHRIPGEPFGFFDSGVDPYDSGVGPDQIGVAPADSYVDPDSAASAPPAQAEDLPPCRETGAGGVVVLRGTGCQR
jgi:hypothetical protein